MKMSKNLLIASLISFSFLLTACGQTAPESETNLPESEVTSSETQTNPPEPEKTAPAPEKASPTPQTSSGTNNGKAYSLTMIESCEKQTLNFKEIAQRDGTEESGTDLGVYYDEQGECAGVWRFDFEVGALLAEVRSDIDASSFALIRQEGDQIFISALTITTGWDIASHVGGTKTKWLGALPAVQTTAGESVEMTFTNPAGDQQISLQFAFSAEMGSVTITEI